MRVLLLTLILLGGCTSVQEDINCVEWATFEVERETCTGGRGVAPVICVPYIETKMMCTRREE